MNKKAWLCGLMGAFALVSCGGSDNGSASVYPAGARQEVASTVEAEIASADLPGVVVGVWTPGKPPLVIERGVSDLSTRRPRASSDPFRIASISKAFIGTAVLTLVDAGRLGKDDKLAKWYPGFPNADRITVGDLLRMRSGIADAADEAFLDEYYANPLIRLTPDQMIARAAARPSEFVPPNTTTRYNNTNFMILERIVEKVSGTDIRSYLASHVTGPLGLKNTYYPETAQLESPLHGYSYEAASGTLVDRTVLNPVPAGGAGALVSTLQDLHTYARDLCRGGLLRPETQADRIVTNQFAGEPPIVRYGEAVAKLGRFCGHNGTIFGFSSEMWYLPERDAVIVINVNRLDKDDLSKSSTLFLKLSKILFPDLTDW